MTRLTSSIYSRGPSPPRPAHEVAADLERAYNATGFVAIDTRPLPELALTYVMQIFDSQQAERRRK